MQQTIGDEYTWASKGMTGLLSEVSIAPDSCAGRAGECGLFSQSYLPLYDTSQVSQKISLLIFRPPLLPVLPLSFLHFQLKTSDHYFFGH